MTSFTLLSRVRRPNDGPLTTRCLPAPSLVFRPPGRPLRPAPPTAVRQLVAQSQIHLQLFFFDVYARAITRFEEAAEVVGTVVFEALFLIVSPSTVFWSFPTRETFGRLRVPVQMSITSSFQNLWPQASQIVLREASLRQSSRSTMPRRPAKSHCIGSSNRLLPDLIGKVSIHQSVSFFLSPCLFSQRPQ